MFATERILYAIIKITTTIVFIGMTTSRRQSLRSLRAWTPSKGVNVESKILTTKTGSSFIPMKSSVERILKWGVAGLKIAQWNPAGLSSPHRGRENDSSDRGRRIRQDGGTRNLNASEKEDGTLIHRPSNRDKQGRDVVLRMVPF